MHGVVNPPAGAAGGAAGPARGRAGAAQLALALVLLGGGSAARAAELDGASLSILWSLPFIGTLLSIALLPPLILRIWHHHYGKITAGWVLLLLIPLLVTRGPGATGALLVHVLLSEYLPFIILLTALFAVGGGIYIRGNLHGSPALNTGLMAIGALLASLMGTTGAAMLLIRPLIRANDNRKHVVHVVVFFIFIVGNAGGALSPLGDPPLFLGFLKGVAFFWPLQHLWPPTLFMVACLLALFYLIDRHRFRKDGVTRRDPTPDDDRFGIDGAVNFVLLGVVVALVLMSGAWQPGIGFSVAGTAVGLEQLVRDGALLVVVGLAMILTPRRVHAANQFSWAPMIEVAKLFAGIFITMAPVLAMLKAGEAGAFAAVSRAVTAPDGSPLPWAYFWLSGALSSFLDNAPTYLVFFNLAGGDPQLLMTTLAPTLVAISAGSVFMGANTYIGNAPNFMVKAIAEERGIPMPSFGGYMLWSAAVLLPLFGLVTLIWMR